MQVYNAFVLSIWPLEAVNILYFLVHAIDGLGGGYRRNTHIYITLRVYETLVGYEG